MNRPFHTPHHSGFTLVEVLVGMAIALIGMVMMFQAMGSWEARKRTTASGSDAQISGSIGMFSFERDLKLAGYGFGNSTAMGCTVAAYDSARTAPGLFNFILSPVVITPNATAGGPVTVTILYGSATTMSSSQRFSFLDNNSIKLNNRTGMQNGDLLIAADTGGNCGLFETTGSADPDGLSVDTVDAAYTNYVNNQNVSAQTVLSGAPLATLQGRFLNNSGSARFNNSTTKSVGVSGSAFNLGTFPRLNVWQITNGRFLTVTNVLANQTTATEVTEGIVNLQAQYGIDANNDGLVGAGEWQSADPAVWSQLRSIRVAVLARSQQFEKNNVLANGTEVPVTPNAPTWAGGSFTMTNLDGTTDSNPNNANDWRRYRYRVYETVIPLRNLLWGLE
jgi:type IV pilus assembly protein PilW